MRVVYTIQSSACIYCAAGFCRIAGELEENNVVQNAKEGPAERLKSDKEVAGNKQEYESGMTSKASGGLELMGVQLQGKVPTERQSSINMEPLTLDDNVMHDAKVLSLAIVLHNSFLLVVRAHGHLANPCGWKNFSSERCSMLPTLVLNPEPDPFQLVIQRIRRLVQQSFLPF
jgi:hypothetical protein